jgi:hypothetical protein
MDKIVMARFIYAPAHPDANHNGFIPAEVYYPWRYGHTAHGSAPAYISDHMAPLRHMGDGQMYDSKAKFRQTTKALGCIEVGNEVSTLTKPRAPVALDKGKRRDDIKRSIWELKNGRRADGRN